MVKSRSPKSWALCLLAVLSSSLQLSFADEDYPLGISLGHMQLWVQPKILVWKCANLAPDPLPTPMRPTIPLQLLLLIVASNGKVLSSIPTVVVNNKGTEHVSTLRILAFPCHNMTDKRLISGQSTTQSDWQCILELCNKLSRLLALR